MSEEIKVLTGVEARSVDPSGLPWPDTSEVICAFEDGKLVGRIGYIFLPHMEATWVAEEKRGGTLAFRLVKAMEKLVAASGSPAVFAYAYDQQPEVGEYLQRIDYQKLPLTIWMKNVETP